MDFRKKELAKNTLIISIGKFSTQLISFLLLPFYTSYLNTSEFGIVDLLMTYSTLFLPVVTLQIESAAFRFLVDSRKVKDENKKVISNVILCTFFSLLIFIILYTFIGNFISVPFYWYLLFYAISSIFSSTFLEISRGLGNNIVYSISSLIIGGFTVVFNVVFLAIFSFGPKSIFLSSILSNLLGCIYIIFSNRLYNFFDIKLIDRNIIRKFLSYSLPLIPSAIIWWIITVSDRLIISYVLGTSSNGLYAVSNKFSNAIISVYTVFHLSWTESMCLYANSPENYDYVTDTFNSVCKIVFSLCITIISCIPFAFSILVNPSYSESYMYIPILIVGSFFNIIGQLIVSLYISFKKTDKLLVASILACVLNVLINVLLINKIGLYAAAISTFISFMVMAIYRLHDLNKYFKLHIHPSSFIIMTIIFSTITFIYYSRNIFLLIIGLVISLGISVFLNRKYIEKLIMYLKHCIIGL